MDSMGGGEWCGCVEFLKILMYMNTSSIIRVLYEYKELT